MWQTIKEMPVTRENVHESVYRSYQVLNEVRKMLARGDSCETIATFIDFCYDDTTQMGKR